MILQDYIEYTSLLKSIKIYFILFRQKENEAQNQDVDQEHPSQGGNVDEDIEEIINDGDINVDIGDSEMESCSSNNK